ncbi:hypothetical protein [Pedobacter sp. SYSU D00535]|uniref:hypothetical protein n=1 Tax=Pedobacter sp. SYSU D00535 TaxID=2810308 RepID=UPI001A96E57D|nr:hypothetical protein [Pedobacter sp. SYSU D00535]
MDKCANLIKKIKEIYDYSGDAAANKFDIREQIAQVIEDYEAEELPKAFTATITVNEYEAEYFLANVDVIVNNCKIIGNTHVPIETVKDLRERGRKLLFPISQGEEVVCSK